MRQNNSKTWWHLIRIGAVALSLTACDKVWELGRKLQAPEPADELPAEPAKSPVAQEEIPPPPDAEDVGPVIDPDIEVSILGYHDFSRTRRATEMVMHPNKLREQMEALKKNQISVISISDFMAWKSGQENIPNPSVVITIDDGWEGVYTEAFPIFKEYGYPFSFYIYTNYIGGGGRSLSHGEIQEMLAYGAQIGSHSVSHASLTSSRSNYDDWLWEELNGSRTYLEERFGHGLIPVFVYPYGNYNDQIAQATQESGYEFALTVSPQKASFSQSNMKVSRFIIHGDDDTNFSAALSFGGSKSMADGNLLSSADPTGEAEPLVAMWPKDQDLVSSRTPRIRVDISRLKGVIKDTLSMQVSGYGKVPFEYDATSGLIQFQIPEPLRTDHCRVSVRLQRRGQKKADYIVWSFLIDRTALYLNEPIRAKPIEVGVTE